MYCEECGQPVSATAKFCSACGTRAAAPTRRDTTVPTVTRDRSNATAFEVAPETREEAPQRRIWLKAAVAVAAVGVLAAGVYRIWFLPSHAPGTALDQDASSWDPFTGAEVASAIRAFDAKIDSEEREAKEKAKSAPNPG